MQSRKLATWSTVAGSNPAGSGWEWTGKMQVEGGRGLDRCAEEDTSTELHKVKDVLKFIDMRKIESRIDFVEA